VIGGMQLCGGRQDDQSLLATSWPDCIHDENFTGVSWPKNKIIVFVVCGIGNFAHTERKTKDVFEKRLCLIR